MTVDYLDKDVAYLLGMLFGNGQFIERGDTRTILINIRIVQPKPKLPPGCTLPEPFDIARENERSLNAVRTRINELLEANVDVIQVGPKTSTLKAVFTKRTISWRNLKLLTSDGSSRHDFRLPKLFFDSEPSILKEFVRGFADVCVTPNAGDALPQGIQRIAFPVVYPNKTFARQLQRILKSLGVKTVNLCEGEASKRGGRAREHRIRVYADEYDDAKIGFTFRHKQELLEILANYNRQRRTGRRS